MTPEFFNLLRRNSRWCFSFTFSSAYSHLSGVEWPQEASFGGGSSCLSAVSVSRTKPFVFAGSEKLGFLEKDRAFQVQVVPREGDK